MDSRYTRFNTPFTDLHTVFRGFETYVTDTLGYTSCSIQGYSNSWNGAPLRINIETRVNDGSNLEDKYIGDADDTPSEALDKVALYIFALKSKDVAEQEEFVTMVGRMIDRGKDLGLDTKIMEPIRAMMVSLSENILENKSKPEPF